MNRPPSNRFRAAWTLIELLVVIAILTALLALVLPVAGHMQSEARATKCMSNMRAYGTALLAFIGENNYSLPDRTTPELARDNGLSYGTWVEPYLKQPLKEFRCPLINTKERDGNRGFGYTGNGALTEYFPRIAGIPAPPSRVVLAAEMFSYLDGFWAPVHFNTTVRGKGEIRPQYHGSEERRGLHLFFLDGHVARVSAPDNEWDQEPTYGTATNEGYFYETKHFNNMKRGKLNFH